MKQISLNIPKCFKELFQPARYKVYYGGRGGAKSWGFADACLSIGASKPTRFLCARELQKSIKDSVHRLLSDRIRELGFESFYTITNDSIKGKNGTEFIFRGLKHNTTEIKSLEGVDICWVEEAENVSNSSWELLIPTIRKDNSEIWVSFNPKNPTDPTYVRFIAQSPKNAIVKKVSWRDNPYFPKVLKDEMEHLKEKDFQAYEHIWEGGFDLRRNGAVYAKQLAKAREEGRITKVPYDPSCEVFTAWDLGYGDSTAIWFFQFVGRELRWLDYYENSGEQLEHYVKIVKEKPYNYGMHYLPHDAAHGNIRGFSVTIQLTNMGIKNTVLANTSVETGIEELRKTIAFSVFDADNCIDGIHCLDNYAYEWDEERQCFKSNPKHDWTSHGADSARYVAMTVNIIKGDTIKPKELNLNKRRSWMS